MVAAPSSDPFFYRQPAVAAATSVDDVASLAAAAWPRMYSPCVDSSSMPVPLVIATAIAALVTSAEGAMGSTPLGRYLFLATWCSCVGVAPSY
jgi:hypothetical protein